MIRMMDFLNRISYREAWLRLEALDSGELPSYLGSTIRGALGHLLRPALCDGVGCGHDCQRPDSCRYFSLFEQSRTSTGRNAPKPLILELPLGHELETIALGGPASLPFRTGPPEGGQTLPTLRNEHVLCIEKGTTLRTGLRLLGSASVALAAIIEAIGRYGLTLGGIRFVLQAADDGTGRLLYDRRLPNVPAQTPALMRLTMEPEQARHIRIIFYTPTILKLDRRPTFDPIDLSARFFEHSLARAVQVHNCLTGEPELPWIEAPPVQARIVGHRLFRYKLPRHSYRQDQWLEFDGVVGHLDLEGKFEAGMPYARAAEILHFGQKATFGLGKVGVLVLD